MKKLLTYLTITLILVFSLSSIIMAADEVKTDLNFGHSWNTGSYWGINYLRDLESDKGSFQSYLHLKKDNWTNKKITGPYLEDGQSVTTIIGQNLGVRYSPYVAYFPNKVVGFRVTNIKYNADMYNVDFDGTYILGTTGWGGEIFDEYDEIVPSQGNFALNANGNLEDVNFNATMLRYTNNENDPEAEYESYINYALSGDVELIDGLNLDAVYAKYGELDTKLYEITGNYDVTNYLSFRAGHSDSDDMNIETDPVRGPGNMYIIDAGKNQINTIWQKDKNYMIGGNYKFNTAEYLPVLPSIDNTLDMEYNTTNPDVRGDLNDSLLSKLNSNYNGYKINQEQFILFTDAETELNRLYYDVSVESPAFEVPGANNTTVTALANYDYSINYDPDNPGVAAPGVENMYLTAGVKLNTTQDIWRLPNVNLQAMAFADMPNDVILGNEAPEELIKYALLAKYDAPNGIKFRVQYYGFEYNGANKDARNNDRYAPYNWYGNDTYGGGMRVAVGIPF